MPITDTQVGDCLDEGEVPLIKINKQWNILCKYGRTMSRRLMITHSPSGSVAQATGDDSSPSPAEVQARIWTLQLVKAISPVRAVVVPITADNLAVFSFDWPGWSGWGQGTQRTRQPLICPFQALCSGALHLRWSPVEDNGRHSTCCGPASGAEM